MSQQQAAFDAAFGPVFAAIKTSPRLELYKAALKKHDWEHDHSDDGRIASLGRAELRRLTDEAAEIDPDNAIWNSIAPKGYRRGAA